MFGGFKKSRTFATAIERESDKKLKGALVQLVRIHACHAWGHGFESRTHRERVPNLFGTLFLFPDKEIFYQFLEFVLKLIISDMETIG